MVRRLLIPLVLALSAPALAIDGVRVLDDDGFDPEIVDIDPGTGVQSRFAGAAFFSDLRDFTTDSTEVLVLYQFPNGALVRVDPTSGSQAVLATGGMLFDAQRIDRGPGGDVFYVDFVNNIVKVDAVTGDQTLVPLGGPSFGDISDLAVEASGDVIVFDPIPFSGLPSVLRVDATTGAQTILSSGGFLPGGSETSIALDPTGTLLYVGGEGFFSTEVIEVDLATAAQRVVTSAGFLECCSLDLDVEPGGDIIATGSENAGTEGLIIRIDPVTGSQTPLASGGFLGGGVEMHLSVEGGTAFVDTSAAVVEQLVQVDLVTATQTLVPGLGGVSPDRIALAETGETFLAGFESLASADATTGAVRMVTSRGFLQSVADLAYGTDSKDVFTIGGVGPGTGIVRIDPALGSQLLVSFDGLLSGALSPAMAANGSDELFVLAQPFAVPAVVRVDPLTGAQTLLPAGALLSMPVDIAVGGTSGDLFILDLGAGPGATPGIVRKNASSGAESLVPTGALPSGPLRIAADGSDRVYLVFSTPPSVLGVDGTTGAQTLFTQDDLLSFPEDIDAITLLPEPGALAMQLAGAAWVLALARRRRAAVRRLA